MMGSRYKINCQKLAKKLIDFEEIQESRSYLSECEIPCIKYNYSLEEEV